jgi:hypothetical protein
MTERITPGKFHQATGLEDRRVLFAGACAHFSRRVVRDGRRTG